MLIKQINKEMRAAASNLEFERAAQLRDELKRLEAIDLGLVMPIKKVR